MISHLITIADKLWAGRELIERGSQGIGLIGFDEIPGGYCKASILGLCNDYVL